VRELIWLLIAILFGYAAFQLYRALRINLKKTGPKQNAVDADATAKTAQRRGGDALMTPATPGSDTPSSVATPSAAEPGVEAFQLALEVQRLRHELARVQGDFISQREQVARLEEGLVLLRGQLESTVASQGVSPEYNEALVFARRGLAVDTIAERCGISVAEAELVRSLAQGGTTDREGT
jgi:hypothetical protein